MYTDHGLLLKKDGLLSGALRQRFWRELISRERACLQKLTSTYREDTWSRQILNEPQKTFVSIKCPWFKLVD